jgi:AICAR transformylase/IMP cyclohydrolase PurH
VRAEVDSAAAGNGSAVARAGDAAWSKQGSAGASDAWAPADSGRERERRGMTHVGRPGGKRSGPSPKEQ